MRIYIILLLGPLFLIGCTIYSHNYTCDDQVATTRNTNVCAVLKDSVVVYPIFIDVDRFHPWTHFDIESTLDSINRSVKWIQNQAISNNQNVCIKVIPHTQKNKLTINEAKVKPTPLRLNLNLLNSSKRKDINHVDHWANKIATYASKAIENPKEQDLATKNKVINVERLTAKLRDLYKTDNIVLMFFVNGYYEKYPSISFHTSSNGPLTEFSIITTKNPAIIAHEFLHLFGAIDLYPTAKYSNFNFQEIKEMYPNEMMRIQHKNIDSLMLSDITKYYIGWLPKLDKLNTHLLYHKQNLLEY